MQIKINSLFWLIGGVSPLIPSAMRLVCCHGTAMRRRQSPHRRGADWRRVVASPQCSEMSGIGAKPEVAGVLTRLSPLTDAVEKGS